MTDHVQPHLLKMAREAAGLLQGDVAQSLQVTQVSVSRWENGNRQPSAEELQRLADLYRVTTDFFVLHERDAGLVASDLHHRRRRGVKVADVRRLEAETNILRIGAERALDHVEMEPILDIPSLSIEECSPQVAAREVRRYWSLPIGPIHDLTQLLELAGAIVVLGDFPTSGLDGVSMWAGHWPVIYLSRSAPPDRRRFTMAHELGHLVLHRDTYSEDRGEREADEFAAEFLMPADQVAPKLRGLTLRRAATLKLEWYVAISAIIRRARDTGAITADQATKLHKQRSAKGWTKREPYADVLPAEQPTTLGRVRHALSAVGIDDEGLAQLLCRPSLDDHPAFTPTRHLHAV